ncbi:glutamine amidotransferase-related protein [Dermabacteraceae bacterium P7074]
MRVLLLDNQDSFVYNLRSEFQTLGFDTLVMRNTVPVAEVLGQEADLICLSPGPGHPRQAGNMMEVLAQSWGKVPLLGICLGFQAMLEHLGAGVGPVGAVHGQAHRVTLTKQGKQDPAFSALPGLRVARYHSLGCTTVPAEMDCLARIGDLVMAARAKDAPALGLQFHPESILTDSGPQLIAAAVHSLTQTKGSAA